MCNVHKQCLLGRTLDTCNNLVLVLDIVNSIDCAVWKYSYLITISPHSTAAYLFPYLILLLTTDGIYGGIIFNVVGHHCNESRRVTVS